MSAHRPDECLSSWHDRSESTDPFLVWLFVNHIDPDITPEWPIIDFDGATPGMIRIEQFQRGADGKLVATQQRLAAALVEVPLVVPMSDSLRAMWEYTAPLARADIERDRALQLLSIGSTVLRVDGGSELVFVTRETLEPAPTKDLLTYLTDIFGRRVKVVTGIHNVIVQDGEIDGL